MLKLLGRSTSINVRKVLWLCEELKLPFEQEEWGVGDLSMQLPEFLALNPNAMVPVIVDGDHVLWESNTICRYLAAREKRTDLLPETAIERSKVEQWMDWQATDLNVSWRYAFMALVRHSPAYGDPLAIVSGISEWNRCMHILDAQLVKTGAFVAGANFTLADIVLGLSANRWLMTPMERPRLTAVESYFQRLRQRPAFLHHGDNGMP